MILKKLLIGHQEEETSRYFHITDGDKELSIGGIPDSALLTELENST